MEEEQQREEKQSIQPAAQKQTRVQASASDIPSNPVSVTPASESVSVSVSQKQASPAFAAASVPASKISQASSASRSTAPSTPPAEGIPPAQAIAPASSDAAEVSVESAPAEVDEAIQSARLSSPKIPKRPAKSVAAEGVEEKKPETVKSARPKRPEKTLTEAEREKKEKAKSSGSKFLNINVREKIMFAKHLGVMLDSGIPLKEALEVMEGQVSSKPMRRMLSVMIRDLSDGFTLSSSLEKFPRVFKPFSVNIVRVGESSGTLPNALHYQAIQLEKAHELQGKIKGALLYPIIIFVGAIGIACYLSFYILPKLLPMFTSLNVKLPPTTRALLATSQFIVQKWPVLLSVIAGVCVFFFLIYKIKKVQYFFHNFFLHLPLFGVMIRAVQVAFFTRILGILLTSGVQIVQAIGVAAESASNLVYKKTIRAVAEQVERGEAITDELEKNTALFPKITTGMIKVGDRTGRLAESLMNAAEFSEKEVDEMTKTLSTLIEPITLLLVGGLVGFIALSIITPIYQITQGIGGK